MLPRLNKEVQELTKEYSSFDLGATSWTRSTTPSGTSSWRDPSRPPSRAASSRFSSNWTTSPSRGRWSPSRPRSTTPTSTSRGRSARTCSRLATSGRPLRNWWRSWRRSNRCSSCPTSKPPWTARPLTTIKITPGPQRQSKWPCSTPREVDSYHHLHIPTNLLWRTTRRPLWNWRK